jgi:hypothetical protein
MDKYSCEYGVPNLLLTKPHEQRSSGAKKKKFRSSRRIDQEEESDDTAIGQARRSSTARIAD